VVAEVAATAMRPGVRLGVDVGTVRVGVAASDLTGTLASPVTVLRRSARDGADLDELAALARERAAVEVVVGLPRSLRDREGVSAHAARDYAREIAARVAPVPVRLVDERLSTVTAQRGMRAAGRSVRASRATIDAAAAVVILQTALDAERASGSPAGEEVSP
jgi:putative Holliday junction resolvase